MPVHTKPSASDESLRHLGFLVLAGVDDLRFKLPRVGGAIVVSVSLFLATAWTASSR